MKGRSAFSVYSEVKEDEKPQFNTNNNRRIVLNDRNNKNKKNVLAPIVQQQQRNQTKAEKLKMKKEKAKFSKLTTENLRESIHLFNGAKNNGNNGHPGAKSAEFRQMSASTKKNQNNGTNKRRLNDTPQLATSKSTKTEGKKLAAGGDVEKKKIIKEVKMKKKLKEVDDEESQEFMFDSRKEAIKLFNKILNPIKHKDFFNDYWEKNYLHVKRGSEDYYKEWFSCKEFDKILRNHNLEFTTNIDVTTYINDVKQKHNPEGRAFAPRVWDFFQQGCSIRLLNPSTYSKNIWQYLSLLQDFFGCCVGANIYLTPKGTQGFAPHYDDIEAFVLQLEGRKRWRIYAPLDDPNTLPRYSSENFTQSVLPEPIFDDILEPGDLLYFPRGFVHQANAVEDIHSLHITVSCYQMNSWGDFLSKLVPGAVETAMSEDVEFRRGLPIGYLDHNGIAFSDNKPTKERAEFRKKTVELFKKLVKHLPIDAAVDQMAKRYIQESLPPSFTKFEKNLSIHGQGETWNESKNRVENISEIAPETTVKLIRKNCLRLVMENESILVYHNLENSKVFCERECVPLEIEVEAAPAIEALIHAYPKYIRVENLPIETLEERITVAQCLYDKGLLVTGEPLECDHEDIDDDDEDECENGSEEDYEVVDEAEEEEDIDDDFNSVDYDNFGDNGEEIDDEEEENDDDDDDENEDEEEDDDEDEDEN